MTALPEMVPLMSAIASFEAINTDCCVWGDVASVVVVVAIVSKSTALANDETKLVWSKLPLFVLLMFIIDTDGKIDSLSIPVVVVFIIAIIVRLSILAIFRHIRSIKSMK